MKYLYAILAIVVTIIFFNIFKPIRINGSAMEPNYPDGTNYIHNTLKYKFTEPNRGDVVVFRFSQNPVYKGLFRVIGLPGEEIKILNGNVYIDNVEIEEPYLANQKNTFALDLADIQNVDEMTGGVYRKEGEKFIDEGEALKIPNNNYFLMGDNREQSSDSRAHGFIKREDILGKLMLRYK